MAKLLSGTRIYGTATVDTQLFVSGSNTASSTITGALQVVGGAGIGGNLYVGGTIYGTITTATNIAAGTAGQLVYQTGAGATGFVNTGTLGQILVSAGTSAPVYTNTSSIYVGRAALADLATTATTATNLAGGLTGSLPYQTSTGTTTMLNISTTAGYVLSSTGSVPQWTSLSSLGAGNTSTATNVVVANETSTSVVQYLTFISVSTGSNIIKVAANSGLTYLPNTNYVGMGIATPTAPLHIVGSVNSVVRFRGASTGTIGVLYSDATQIALSDYSISNAFIILSTSSAVSLTTAGTEAIRVDSSQYVGINTNRPNYRLDVRGQTYIGASTSAPQLILGDTTNSTTSTITTNNGDLIFSSNGTTEALRITSLKGIAFGGSTNYGTSGQLLQSNGNASPTWINQSSLSAVNINATANTNAFEYIVGVSASGSTTTAATVSTTNPVGFNASTGVVSIGGTSSYGKLTVIGGTSNASSLATAQSLSTLYIQPKNTSGYGFAFGSGPGDLPYIQQVNISGSASGNMTLQPYGGYIGIGITNPSYNLVVSNAGAEGIEFGPGYSSGKNLFQSYNRSGSSYVQLDSIASIFTWAIGASEKIRLTANGGLAFNGPTNYGTSGQVLQSNGDASPTWVTISTGAASTATNIAGGSTGQIPYQTATSATGFSSNLAWNSGTNILTVTGTVQTSIFSRTGNLSTASWTTVSPIFNSGVATLTDTSSAASATVTFRAGASLQAPTFASTNAITVTNATNLYVDAPVAGTNVTITNSWGLWNQGNSFVGGNEKVSGSLAVGTYSVTANTGDILASGNGYFGTSSQLNTGFTNKLNVLGSIVAGGSGSTNGTILLQSNYGTGSLTNIGTEYSSGGPVIGYGVYPSSAAAGTFLSSYGAGALNRAAYTISGNQHNWYVGASQTVALGNNATLTLAMSLTSAGALAFNGASNYGTSGQILQSNGNAAPTWISASGLTAGSLANALTISSPLSGTSYNGSSAVTIALASGYGDTQNPYASKTANYVLAAPNGSAGTPSFRALVAADIPSLSGIYLPLAGGTMSGGINATTINTTQGNSDVSGTNSALRLLSPGGASSWQGASSVTGAIKIKLPTGISVSNTMLRFTVKVYTYDGLSFDINCGGYTYTTAPGVWINTFAYMTTQSRTALNVRFGYDTGTANYCVYIGELATVWSYCNVFVTDFQAGYANYAASTWNSGWAISWESSAFANTSSTQLAGPQVIMSGAAGTANGSNYVRFGPNATWSSYLQVGGDGVNAITRTDSIASVVTTNGNLHLDSGSSRAIYLNYYSGTSGIYFGNGASGTSASVTAAGGYSGTSASFSGAVYGTIFYDYNDSTYYLDPNGSGKVTGTWQFARGNNSSTSYSDAGIQLRESQYGGSVSYNPPTISWHWGGVVASQISIESSGRIKVINNPGTSYEAFIASITYGSASVRGPIFYDSDNTAYYADPGGSSYFSNMSFAATAGITGMGGYTPSNYLMRMTPNLHLNAYNGYAVILNWDNGTTGSSQTLRIGNGASSDVFYINANGYTYLPYIYDINDTGYYLDPNGSSLLSYVMANNWFRPVGNTGVYWNSYGRGIWAADSEISYGNITTYSSGLNGWRGYGVYPNNCILMANGSNWGMYNPQYGWLMYGDMSGNTYFTGNVTAYWSDLRLKENVREIDNVIERRNGLAKSAIKYDRDGMTMIGYGAQTLQENGCGEFVHEADDERKIITGLGTLSVDYAKTTAILAVTSKLTDDRVAELEATVAKLEKMIIQLIGDKDAG